MLTEDKEKAIVLLIENKRNKTDISEILGIARSTLYDWMRDDEFKAELDKRLQEIQTYGVNQIKANLNRYISNIEILANTADSEKICLDANEYLIDRILGKTTTKVDIEATPMAQVQEIDDTTIDAEIEEMLDLVNNIQENNE